MIQAIPDETIWVCGVCGESFTDAADFEDDCIETVVLCKVESVKYGEGGKVTQATPVMVSS